MREFRHYQLRRGHDAPRSTRGPALFAGLLSWCSPRSTRRASRRPLFETLEPRQLLAVDAMLPLLVNSDQLAADLAVQQPHQPANLADGEMAFLAAGPHPRDWLVDHATNRNAADTTNTDQLQPGGASGLNLTGAGYTVGVWEVGGSIRDTHQELAGRVTVVDSFAFSDHATHVAGTIGASGVNGSAEGMATAVSLRSRTSSNDLAEMGTDASLIDVSNHSYSFITGWVRLNDFEAPGGGVTTPSGQVDVWWHDYSESAVEDADFGKYDSNPAALDQVLHSNPHLVSVWAAGNDRNDTFTDASSDNTYVTYFSNNPGGIGWAGPGWYLATDGGTTPAPLGDGNAGTGFDSLSQDQTAKNSIVVGAVHDVTADPYTSGSISTSSFSSYGPTDDGRIKPDLVGNGVSLRSSVSASDTSYANFSGTSMSAPNVAGTSVLLIEHFENLYASVPPSATTKGLMIHTASDAGNTGPDYAYGWGLVDAASAADFLSDSIDAGSTSIYDQGTYAGSEITLGLYSDGVDPLKATIVWTDPAGSPQSSGLDDPTPVLVNDLDLWITGSTDTFLPWTLDGANPTAPAVRSQANHVDNVEQVLIDAPDAGFYTLFIGNSGAPLVQDYSLFVSGATNQVPGIDLLGSQLSVDDENLATAGGVAAVDLAVRNQGDTNAGPFDIQFYLSDDAVIEPGTDLLLQLDAADPAYDAGEPEAYHLGGLAASATFATTVALALPGTDPFNTDRQYFIGMFSDADGDVIEVNEINNLNRGVPLDQVAVTYRTPATVPFLEDWESGTLASYWDAIEGVEGRIQLTSANSPFAGNFHLTMDDSAGDGAFSTNQLILHVDLAGKSGVELSFANREWSDEDHAQDVVQLSVDGGANWVDIVPLTGSNSTSTYTTRAFDLDALGVIYSSDTLIRFQQHDNWPIADDGMAFDNIAIALLNTPPTISDLADQATDEDTSTVAIPFTIGDAESLPDQLAVSASSSDETLVPGANILVQGTGTERTLSIAPAADQFGVATITITVDDGLEMAFDTFELTVQPIDDLVPYSGPLPVDAAGDGSAAVVLADVDGDADLDVVSASALDDTVAWHENTDGTGNFAARSIITSSAAGARSVFAADVDNDGDLDILAASYLDDTVAWYENTDGLGAFGSPQIITSSADGAEWVSSADVDGDGDLDVLSASSLDDTIAWYANLDGAGVFGPQQIVSSAAVGARTVVTADVDNDGDIDLVTASAGDDTIAWYANTDGSGTFGPQQLVTNTADGVQAAQLADIDRDGDLDIVSASPLDGTIGWFENTDGIGAFGSLQVIRVAAGASSVFVADIDADGDPDVASTAAADGEVVWHENLGSGLFGLHEGLSLGAGDPRSVVAGDIDGDGDADILYAAYVDDMIEWQRNETIHRSALFPIGMSLAADVLGASSVIAADVDGDADADLVTASSLDDTIAWIENSSGLGDFGTKQVVASNAGGASSVVAADVDADGDTDILFAARDDDTIGWLENTDGLGGFGAKQVITTLADGAAAVLAADLDLDGDVDVLSASTYDDRIAWYAGDGTGGFSVQQTINVPDVDGDPATGLDGNADGATAVFAADLDGDGDLDVLTASGNDNKIAWHENRLRDPESSFGLQQVISSDAAGAVSVFAADVDNDGDLDVLSASAGDNTIAWYENTDSAGGFGPRQLITTSAVGASTVRAADLDRDGDLDVLSTSFDDDTLGWYENDGAPGTPGFGPRQVITSGADGARAVVAADLDRDGDLDLATASTLDNSVAWYANRGGQFALQTSDTAPVAIIEGRANDVLSITVDHRGRLGDHGVELASLSLLLEESLGDPLSTAEANAVVERVEIYLDDGSGTFEPGVDIVVASVDALTLSGGVLVTELADDDPGVQISFGNTATFFVVLEMAGDAAGQGIGQLRVTHVTESSSRGEDAEADIPLQLEYVANAASSAVEIRLLGDMDRDGDVELDDVMAFVLALNDEEAYEAIYGWPAELPGDIDGDGDHDLDDVRGFVQILTGSGSASAGAGAATTSDSVQPALHDHVQPARGDRLWPDLSHHAQSHFAGAFPQSAEPFPRVSSEAAFEVSSPSGKEFIHQAAIRELAGSTRKRPAPRHGLQREWRDHRIRWTPSSVEQRLNDRELEQLWSDDFV